MIAAQVRVDHTGEHGSPLCLTCPPHHLVNSETFERPNHILVQYEYLPQDDLQREELVIVEVDQSLEVGVPLADSVHQRNLRKLIRNIRLSDLRTTTGYAHTSPAHEQEAISRIRYKDDSETGQEQAG